MDNKTRIAVDHIKNLFSNEGKMMRQLNRTIPVQGVRHVLSLVDRDIDIVFYSAKREYAPLIIGLHGGGFVFGGSAFDDDMWVAIRDSLDVNIASIDYRKCPDYRWPAPVEDVFECACYLKEHAGEFGFNPEHMSVMGFSAGANLAATACIKAKQEGVDLYKYQFLIYPCIDLVTPPDQKGKEGSFDPAALYAFNELYVDAQDASHILASPVFAKKEELEGLPTAVVTVAEKDELQHEGIKYAEMLKEAGIEVAFKLLKDMPHGYFEFAYERDPAQRQFDDYALKCWKDGSMKAASMETLELIKTVYK